jgi:hypothetical protein
MPRDRQPSWPAVGNDPLSIEQLKAGLRLLGRGDVDQIAFWDQNIEAFRQTVLFAIRETSDALLSPRIPRRWSAELEAQLELLVQYIELADRYIAGRSLSREQPAVAFPSSARLH